jgi:hypothetical protein
VGFLCCIQIAEIRQHLRKLDALHHYGCFLVGWYARFGVFAIIQGHASSCHWRWAGYVDLRGLTAWGVDGCVAYWNSRWDWRLSQKRIF